MANHNKADQFSGGPEVTVRPVGNASELQCCAALYREVFEIPSEKAAVTHRLLASIQHNSGTVTGAFLRDRLVGFTYSFLARTAGGELYHYSQLAVVATDVQGRGVGRSLKFGQRLGVQAQNIELIRWAFDPLQGRNAHFNLDVLGAIGRTYHADLYGAEPVVESRSLPTSRMVVDWELNAPSVAARAQTEFPEAIPLPGEASHLRPGQILRSDDSAYLAVPRDWDGMRRADPDSAGDLQARTGQAIEAFLGDGLAAVTCQRASAATAVYRFAPDRRG